MGLLWKYLGRVSRAQQSSPLFVCAVANKTESVYTSMGGGGGARSNPSPPTKSTKKHPRFHFQNVLPRGLPGRKLLYDLFDLRALASAPGPDRVLFHQVRLESGPAAAPLDGLQLGYFMVRPARP